MERVFTRDVGAKFKRGDIREFPTPTWRRIAESAGVDLDKFSRPTADLATMELDRPKRGRPPKALAQG